MRFTSVLCLPNHILYTYNIYHLFTETEGNSVFCGPETAVAEAKPRATTAVEGPQNTLLS